MSTIVQLQLLRPAACGLHDICNMWVIQCIPLVQLNALMHQKRCFFFYVIHKLYSHDEQLLDMKYYCCTCMSTFTIILYIVK